MLQPTNGGLLEGAYLLTLGMVRSIAARATRAQMQRARLKGAARAHSRQSRDEYTHRAAAHYRRLCGRYGLDSQERRNRRRTMVARYTVRRCGLRLCTGEAIARERRS